MTTKSKSRKILIMCESSGWQWGLGTEFVNYELKNGNFYEVVDLSFVGNFRFSARLRLIFGGFTMRKESLSYFKQKNLKVTKHQGYGKIPFRKELSQSYLKQSPAYNSIAERCQTLDFELISRKAQLVRIAKEEIRKSDLVLSVLLSMDFSDVEKVVTVNGRFTKSATIIKFCKERGIKFELLEGGHKNTSFQIFDVGPHSTRELNKKITQLWNAAVEPYRSEISRKYLENLVINRKRPGVDFRSKIVWDRLPKFSGKKICVFFASSEWEYLGVREEVPPGHFESQIEAFKALVDCLDSATWDIYLRLHPTAHTNDNPDGENIIWIPFRDIPNIIVIEPNSDIDSIALGLEADLIASYGSGIDMEFYARKLGNAITMGLAPWSFLLPERHIPTIKKLQEFINLEKSNIEINKLLPWAYYQVESGIEFELISTNEKTGRWRMKKITS